MFKRRTYNKLFSYIGWEYIFSFFIAFLFFFFIFFVNQIIVIAQKIAIKKVEISQLITLVVLSIPQFLMYTMPFSSLASASMVIGNLSSQNEILALRSNGINVKHIFMPIVIISFVFSAATLAIADRMIPYTSYKYKELYSEVLQNLPTIELESYSSTNFNDIVISNGAVEGNIIHDILVYDNTSKEESRVISAKEATLTLLDLDRLLYRIDLVEPQILLSDKDDSGEYSSAQASNMSLYVKLSTDGDDYYDLSPSQMSINELKNAMDEKNQERLDLEYSNELSKIALSNAIGKNLRRIENEGPNDLSDIYNVCYQADNLNNYLNFSQYSFYYQYYRCELYKKFALAFACTALVFMAFPISFFKVKYGRLIGFGISMFIACIYWFFIYFMHTRAIMSNNNPYLYIHLPNILSCVIGLILIIRLRKK